MKLLLAAIERAGYQPGTEIALGLDVAASELFDAGKYVLAGEKRTFTSAEFADYLADLCGRYPIVSIEDGMAEDDWEGWATLTRRLGGEVQLVGDDVFVTNSERLGAASTPGSRTRSSSRSTRSDRSPPPSTRCSSPRARPTRA